MKVNEIFTAEDNFEDQLTEMVRLKIMDKFGFKATAHVYTGHKGFVFVQLVTPSQVKDEELITQMITNFLNKELAVLDRDVVATPGTTSFSPSRRKAELEIRLNWK